MDGQDGRLGPGSTAARPLVSAALATLLSLLLVALPSRPAEAAPGLLLEPPSGFAGGSVRATAAGFEDCVVIDVGDGEGGEEVGDGEGGGVDAVATPSPSPSDAPAEDAGPATVTFRWDGTDVVGASMQVTGGAASATFVVPAGAVLGQHTVSAECDQNPKLVATAPFEVVPPEPVPVVVPDVVGMSLADARAALDASDLREGRVSAAGAVVRRQEPSAGAAVDPGTAVDLVLGAEPPVTVVVPEVTGLSPKAAERVLVRHGLALGGISSRGEVVVAQAPSAFSEAERGSAVDVTLGPRTSPMVRVPDLTGSDVDAVPRILASRGLVLGTVAGDGSIVRTQRPAPGTLVPRHTVVTLSVDRGVLPPSLVPVPDLAGDGPAAARRALARVGLRLSSPAEGVGGEVVAQAPVAGVLVPRRTVVTVSWRAATSPSPSPSPSSTASPPGRAGPSLPLVALAVAGGAVLLGAGATSHQVLRRRRAQTWVHGHVRAVPGGTTLERPRTDVREQSPEDKDVVVRIEPYPDSGSHLLEEV